MSAKAVLSARNVNRAPQSNTTMLITVACSRFTALKTIPRNRAAFSGTSVSVARVIVRTASASPPSTVTVTTINSNNGTSEMNAKYARLAAVRTIRSRRASEIISATTRTIPLRSDTDRYSTRRRNRIVVDDRPTHGLDDGIPRYVGGSSETVNARSYGSRPRSLRLWHQF